MNNRRHVHSMTSWRYLVLLVLVIGSTLGDAFISRGMKDLGRITLSRWDDLLLAVTDPWVGLGTVLLVLFFTSYLSSLSWADLSYIMPTTAFGNVLTGLIARFALHERVPATRWAGILLITAGVGFIARGPSLTVDESAPAATPLPRQENEP